MCYTIEDLSDDDKGFEYADNIAEARYWANQGEHAISASYEDEAAEILSMVENDEEFQKGIQRHAEYLRKYPGRFESDN